MLQVYICTLLLTKLNSTVHSISFLQKDIDLSYKHNFSYKCMYIIKFIYIYIYIYIYECECVFMCLCE
jgi:hypothetical protein